MDFGPIAVYESRSQCCVFHRDKHQSFDQTRLVEAVKVTAPIQLAREGWRRQEATQAQVEDRDGDHLLTQDNVFGLESRT